MPSPSTDAPLIVTASLSEASFTHLDALRQTYFPAALNRVPAHISLFHHLPGAEVRRVLDALRAQCRGRSSFDLRPSRWMSLGRGVAIAYEAGPLGDLHGALALLFSDWLTAQDRQPFKAHVTIQNKVTPAAARDLLDRLGTTPLTPCRVEGLLLWSYLGGPWDRVADVPFDDVQ